MGQHVSREDFEHTYTDEPHATRRREILKKYPEVKTLFGPDPMLLFWVSLIVIFQICSLYFIQDLNWPMTILLAYCLGGTLNHSLTLAIHEIAHNLVFGFKWPLANRAVGMWANLPLGIPMASTFKPYHLMHHRYLGVPGGDSDLPSKLEGRLFCTTFGKLIWVILLPFFYCFRPMIVSPLPISKVEIVNLVVQLVFNALVVYFFNLRALLYLVIGTVLSIGLHPMTGHFIAEHYMFVKGQETYSYYGPFNWITFNVGYHNEHHDFPFVAFSRLPKLKAMVPEYYDNLHVHESWIKVLYAFITDPSIGPYARTIRERSKIKEDKNVPLLVEKWEFDVNGLANATGVAKCEPNPVSEPATNGVMKPDTHGGTKLVTNGVTKPETNDVTKRAVKGVAKSSDNGFTSHAVNGVVTFESNGVAKKIN